MLLLLVFFLNNAVQAATVTGKLYDKDFNLLKNSVVEINTFPKQTYVAKEGEYSFSLTTGRFTLTAFHKLKNGTVLFSSKTVLMSSSGTYNVDLILDRPYTGQELPTELNHPKVIFGINPMLFYTILSVMAIIILLLIYFLFKKHKMHVVSEDKLSDLEQFVKEIKEAGGRMTQKDLREKFQKYSEAKVSLVIAELESKGLVEKIKKGRGNIVILKKTLR